MIALYPNYFLTLCINWPKRELDADKYALKITGNAFALRDALLKISASLVWNPQNAVQDKIIGKVPDWGKKYLTPKRIEIFNDVVATVKFYISDILLGYSYPLLSERLIAIDSFQQENAQKLGDHNIHYEN